MNRNVTSPLLVAVLAFALLSASPLHSQNAPATPAPAAQPPPATGRNQPNYPVPYTPASVEQITEILNRIHAYLASNSPARMVNRETGAEITDFSKPDPQATLERGTFQVTSYEWGVTYAGMLQAAEATGDARFKEYVAKRMEFIANAAPYFRALSPTTPAPGQGQGRGGFAPFRAVNSPRSLDDSGAMCAGMLKAHRAGLGGNLRPLIDNYINFISTGQFRFPDGTLARHRPMPDALWLDDLYMSVPALAQMGKLTGDRKYYDDAVKQILQFAGRMFVKEKGLYMHGWVQGMDTHPVFHWARANGWAIVAKAELLEVLPEDHPGRAAVLDLYRAHVRGLAACQGGDGLWHQLLDRTDSYLETSASAMFVYSIARGINRGWLHPLAHGPMASLGWNAVARKVNAQGQVEGTCVGTGMGFEPTFYYYRPTSVLAAHGYGPVLLAGAEMVTLRKGKGSEALISDGAVQFMRSPSSF